MALTVGFLIAADAKDDDAKKELKKLEGNWQVISMEIDGQKMPEEDAKQYTVLIKGDKYTLKMQDNPINQGTIKVDPTKKPKTIDITPTDGDNSGKTMLGIYEQDGDTQKTCYTQPDKPRPTKFSSEGGNTLIVYKKMKS
jgi:uncharacterized protein (TIGR03067 family)